MRKMHENADNFQFKVTFFRKEALHEKDQNWVIIFDAFLFNLV